jgi:hypothetical protein
MKLLWLIATLCAFAGCRTRPEDEDRDLSTPQDMAVSLCNGTKCLPPQTCAFPSCTGFFPVCEIEPWDGGCPRFYELTDCGSRPGKGCARAGPQCVDVSAECASGQYSCWWLYESNRPMCCKGTFPDCN